MSFSEAMANIQHESGLIFMNEELADSMMSVTPFEKRELVQLGRLHDGALICNIPEDVTPAWAAVRPPEQSVFSSSVFDDF